MHIRSHIIFHHRGLRGIDYGSLCYAVGLAVYFIDIYIVVCIC